MRSGLRETLQRRESAAAIGYRLVAKEKPVALDTSATSGPRITPNSSISLTGTTPNTNSANSATIMSANSAMRSAHAAHK